MRSSQLWLRMAPLLILLHGTVVQAQQVIPDGRFNTITTSTNGRDFVITGGEISGRNLFHSFSEFSVPTGGAAIFNAANVQNIFSRVTSASPSSIDGVLRSPSPANLFLLNPNGILFGPNAKLEIGGAFLATTADRIRFVDGVEFGARADQPLLTMSAPVGVQFGAQAATIENRAIGGLKAAPGKTLGLLGGNVTLEGGKLTSFGGNIEVGSVAPGSDVALLPIPQGWTLGYGNGGNFQDIALQQGAAIDATGLGGGSIQVQGRKVSLQNASTISSGTLGAIPGGTVVVRGSESIELINTFTPNFLVGGISTFVVATATGNAASLMIETPNLNLYNGLIAAGNIGSGSAGNILVKADQLTVRNQDTGTRSISGIFSTVLGGSGRGGDIQVKSQRISLQNGSTISTGTFGSGASGNIDIQADDLEAIGFSTVRFRGSSISTEVFNAFATGKGGDIMLNVGRLKLIDGGNISAATSGSGDAGSININAKDIEVSGSVPFASFDGKFQNSGISASANPLLIPPGLPPGSTLTPLRAMTSGAAGSITLSADRITLRDRGSISVVNFSNVNKQSNIEITANDLILRQGGQITTDSRGNVAGGNIRLNTNFLIALENSDITANAVNSFGGRVFVNAQSVIGTAFRSQLTPESDITASSELGAEFSGKVEFSSPGVDLSQGLTALPVDTIDPGQQIAAGCGSQSNSQFVVTGRGGTAVNPIDANPFARPWSDLRQSITASTPTRKITAIAPLEIIEATAWRTNSQGQPELIAAKTGGSDRVNATCAKSSSLKDPL
jgi:filamentous hemagglutinin family protein